LHTIFAVQVNVNSTTFHRIVLEIKRTSDNKIGKRIIVQIQGRQRVSKLTSYLLAYVWSKNRLSIKILWNSSFFLINY
jgi:hypothetical protein